MIDMFEVRLTSDFSSWLDGLKDRRAQDRIVARLRRLSLETLATSSRSDKASAKPGSTTGQGIGFILYNTVRW
jgi:putative component of toxin-antitoxin plasmid stabilization module